MKKNSPIFLQLKQLWQYISSRRRIQLGILLILMIVTSLAEVISIGAVLPFLGVLTTPEKIFELQVAQPLIKILEISQPKQLLLPLTIIFAIAALFSGAMRLILLWMQTRLSHAIGADISIDIYRRTLYQPFETHIARNSSELIASITNKANNLVTFTILPVLAIFSSVLILFTILILLIAIEPFTAFTAIFGFGSIYILIILLTKKRLAQNSLSISEESNYVVQALQEGLGGIRDILISGTQSNYCDIYSRANQQLRHAQANVIIVSASPRFIIEALGMVLISILAYILAGRPEGIGNAIPILGALALGAQRMLPVLQQAYQSWSSLLGNQASLTDVLSLLKQPLPDDIDQTNIKPLPFAKTITLKDLSFRYSKETPWILHKLDITISKGDRIGFIGTTGSGKSTLMDVVMGLLHPTEGGMSIDGQLITVKNHRAWQAHIAHVPQTIFLADTTLAENIAFGTPTHKIDHEKVKHAAQQAQIADTIETWKEKYQTKVGERGVRLSGGQRQRIGIARALYNKANFIVFDEATSALDNETELAIMDSIKGLSNELTVLIVAHRLTTLKSCNKIIELEAGKIIRSGTYKEIIGSK